MQKWDHRERKCVGTEKEANLRNASDEEALETFEEHRMNDWATFQTSTL